MYSYIVKCEGSARPGDGVHHGGQAADGPEAVQLTPTDVLRGRHR